MHKCYRCLIVDLRFLSWRKSKFPKQCLLQGHCQVQPMKARPWGFTLEIEAPYSRRTTKKAFQLCCHPRLPRLLLLVANTRHTEEPVPHFPHRNQCPHRHYKPSITTTITSSSLSVSWKSICRHVPWHWQKTKLRTTSSWGIRLMKRACATGSIPF
jgi:hypothetical protein